MLMAGLSGIFGATAIATFMPGRSEKAEAVAAAVLLGGCLLLGAAFPWL
jgi:hypothetical protein